MVLLTFSNNVPYQEKPKNGYADSPVNRESSTLSKEPLADTKQVRKPGNEQVIFVYFEYNNVMRFLVCDSLVLTFENNVPYQEKPKNGYIVSHVNRESSTSEEILPLLQSLLVQNDIQRVCVLSVSTASCGYTSPKWLLRFGF